MGGHGTQVKGLQQPADVIPLAEEQHLVLHAQLHGLGLQGEQIGTVPCQHQAGTGLPLMQPRKGLQQEGMILLIRQPAHMTHHQAVGQAVMGTHFLAHPGVKAVLLRVDGGRNHRKGQIQGGTGPARGFLRAGPEHVGITGQTSALGAVERSPALACQRGIRILRIVAVGDAHRDAEFRRHFQRRHIAEHALVVPDHIILPGMFFKEGPDFPVVLHRLLAAAGDDIGFAQGPTALGIGGILIPGEKVKPDPLGIDPAAIGHQEVLNTAGGGRHADHQNADGLHQSFLQPGGNRIFRGGTLFVCDHHTMFAARTQAGERRSAISGAPTGSYQFIQLPCFFMQLQPLPAQFVSKGRLRLKA